VSLNHLNESRDKQWKREIVWVVERVGQRAPLRAPRVRVCEGEERRVGR
jgi:hypothetical protein